MPNADFAPVPDDDVATGERTATAPHELRQFPDAGLTPQSVLRLQQTAGNRAVGALVQRQELGDAPGRLTPGQLDSCTAELCEHLSQPGTLTCLPTIWQAWGRKPGAS